MNEMVQLIFSRLDAIPGPPDSPFARGSSAAPHTAPRLQVSPVPSRAATVLADEGEEEGQAPSNGAEAAGEAANEASAAAAASGDQPGEAGAAVEGPAAPVAAAADVQLATPAQPAASGVDGTEAHTPASHSPALPSPATGEIVSLLPTVQGSPGGIAGYGVEAVYEVLAFIISLVATGATGATLRRPLLFRFSQRCCVVQQRRLPAEAGQQALCVCCPPSLLPFLILHLPLAPSPTPPTRHPTHPEPVGSHQDLPAHGLDLLGIALQAAGPALEAHESLLGLLQRELTRAMFKAARQPSLACLAGICQVGVGTACSRRACANGGGGGPARSQQGLLVNQLAYAPGCTA
jgi:hypothetical protein